VDAGHAFLDEVFALSSGILNAKFGDRRIVIFQFCQLGLERHRDSRPAQRGELRRRKASGWPYVDS